MKAQADLQEWMAKRDDLEAQIRTAQQAVDKCTLDLAAAEHKAKPSAHPHFTVDQDTVQQLVKLQAVLQQSGAVQWSLCSTMRWLWG